MGVNFLTPENDIGRFRSGFSLSLINGKMPLQHLLSIEMRSTARSNADADPTPCDIDEIASVATLRTFLICIPRRRVPNSGA